MPKGMRVLIGRQFSDNDHFHVRQLIRSIKTERDDRDICRPVGLRASAHGATGATAMGYLHLARAKPIPVKVGVKATDDHEGHANQKLFFSRHRKPAEQQVAADTEQSCRVR
jgi:hypothetical protein